MAQEKIILNKTGYNHTQFSRVINTTFSQTVTPTPPTASNPIATVNDFFNAYDTLFYSIPTTGETDSHEYLIKRSTEYVGGESINETIQALINEINNLRAESVETFTQQSELIQLRTENELLRTQISSSLPK